MRRTRGSLPGLEANGQLRRLQIELMGRQLRTWAEHGRNFGRTWAGVAGLSDYVLRLTPEQARQMTDEVYEVLDRWAGEHPASTPEPGAELVLFHTAGFPTTGP